MIGCIFALIYPPNSLEKAMVYTQIASSALLMYQLTLLMHRLTLLMYRLTLLMYQLTLLMYRLKSPFLRPYSSIKKIN